MSKQKHATPDQPHKHHPHDDELAPVKAFLASYSRPILIAIIGVSIAGAAAVNWRNRQTAQRVDASRALAEARAAVELEDVVNNYPGSPSAPIALLTLGRLQYDQRDFKAARATYQRFLDTYKDHPMTQAAALGRLHAIEASGALAEAADSYEQFIAAHPDHYLTPQAIFGLARTHAARGNVDAARAIYETFIDDNPDSPWNDYARNRLERVDEPPAQTIIPSSTDAPIAGPDTAPPAFGPVIDLTPVAPAADEPQPEP